MAREMAKVVADLRLTPVMQQFCDITKEKGCFIYKVIETLQICKCLQLLKHTHTHCLTLVTNLFGVNLLLVFTSLDGSKTFDNKHKNEATVSLSESLNAHQDGKVCK